MIVGLTGGIASGKTVVSRVFELLGAAVFYSDEAARQAYNDSQVRTKVIELIGERAYDPEGMIDRKFISTKIFKEPRLRDEINRLIHPYVGVLFAGFVKENPGKVVMKESALLFEAGIARQCDKVIVVAAPDQQRVARICARDGVSREEAVLKIESQMPQEEKIQQADFVLHNDGAQLLIPQVINVYNQLSDSR